MLHKYKIFDHILWFWEDACAKYFDPDTQRLFMRIEK